MTATKYDQAKPDLSILPKTPLEEIAKVMAFGAAKYGRGNWREGMAWSRYVSAALRHTFAFNENEDIDPESGLLHLAHAACNLLFLMEYYRYELGQDDRRKDLKSGQI